MPGCQQWEPGPATAAVTVPVGVPLAIAAPRIPSEVPTPPARTPDAGWTPRSPARTLPLPARTPPSAPERRPGPAPYGSGAHRSSSPPPAGSVGTRLAGAAEDRDPGSRAAVFAAHEADGSPAGVGLGWVVVRSSRRGRARARPSPTRSPHPRSSQEQRLSSVRCPPRATHHRGGGRLARSTISAHWDRTCRPCRARRRHGWFPRVRSPRTSTGAGPRPSP